MYVFIFFRYALFFVDKIEETGELARMMKDNDKEYNN